MRWWSLAFAVFGFWLVLAWPADAGGLLWGLALSLLIGTWAAVVLWPTRDAGLAVRHWPRALLYLLLLPRSIVPAALQLIALLLRRRIPIHPEVFVYRTTLASEAGRVALANAITLTPGTHCVELADDELTIHCLHPGFAADIRSGEVEAGIRRVFEPEDGP
ncbi:MAG: Na+/H+ antiporter subunit E [Wenzhouxiangellaceae bacterium]|nr:Na+/H+ antiporter subunit E [Wenzhouxiangellaceae bacterium]